MITAARCNAADLVPMPTDLDRGALPISPIGCSDPPGAEFMGGPPSMGSSTPSLKEISESGQRDAGPSWPLSQDWLQRARRCPLCRADLHSVRAPVAARGGNYNYDIYMYYRIDINIML